MVNLVLNLKYKSYTNGHKCQSYLRRLLVLLYHLHSINHFQCPLFNTDCVYITSILTGTPRYVMQFIYSHLYCIKCCISAASIPSIVCTYSVPRLWYVCKHRPLISIVIWFETRVPYGFTISRPSQIRRPWFMLVLLLNAESRWSL